MVTPTVLLLPYRMDIFVQFLRLAHPTKSFSLSTIHSEVANKYFFNVAVQYAETIESHHGTTDQGLVLSIEGSIINLLNPFYLYKDSIQITSPIFQTCQSISNFIFNERGVCLQNCSRTCL